jgi:hypothetical protein
MRRILYVGLFLYAGATTAREPPVGQASPREFELKHLYSAQEKKELTAKASQQRARILYKMPSADFKKMNDAAECATRLIEKRATLGAVVLGASYLHKILQDSAQSHYSELPLLLAQCERKSALVKNARQLFSDEDIKKELNSQLQPSALKAGLIKYIEGRLSHEVTCTQTDIVLKIGAILGFKCGFGSAKCETPFGRRFMLSGPVIGGGIDAFGLGIFREKSSFALPMRRTFAYIALDEVGFHLCKREKIKPNFVPLFDYFKIKIPGSSGDTELPELKN